MTKNPRSYKKLIKLEGNHLAYGISHTFVSGLGQTFLISMFVPAIRAEFGFSSGFFGVLYSGSTIGASLLVPVTGRLIDQINLKKYSYLIGAGLFASVLALTLSNDVISLAISLVFMRLFGQSLMPHISATATARYFTRDRGRALAVSMFGHPLGEAILPLVITSMLLTMDWRTTMGAVALTCAVCFYLLIYFLVPKSSGFVIPPSKTANSSAQGASPKDVLKDPYFYSILPIVLIPPLLLTGFIFHQGAISAIKGWSDNWLGQAFLSFALARVVFSFSVGPLIDQWGAAKLLIIYLAPLALGIFTLDFFSQSWVAPIYLGLAGATVGLGSNIKNALWAETYGPKHLGAIRSLIAPLTIFSTAVSPPLFGYLFDYGLDFTYLSVISIGLCFLATISAAIGIKSQKTYN